jgi:hypothetical protein
MAGVNRLPSVGLRLFSVGAAGAALDGGAVLDGVVVVVEGVVVVDGAWLPPLPHPAVSAPIAMRAAPPAIANMRRPIRFELIVNLLSVLARLVASLSPMISVNPRRFGRGWRRYHLGGEQVSTSGVEAFFRRGRRRGGRRRCSCRRCGRRCRRRGRRRLIAIAATSGGNRTHGDERRTTSDSHQATTKAVRSRSIRLVPRVNYHRHSLRFSARLLDP